MSLEIKNNQYQCASCHGIFEKHKEWTEEKKLKEKQQNFGDLPLENCEIVCDDCYNKIMKAINN